MEAGIATMQSVCSPIARCRCSMQYKQSKTHSRADAPGSPQQYTYTPTPQRRNTLPVAYDVEGV